ncbi:putative AC9 transposase [Aspergillus awamori]|uniref:Putative AC9 transposase n=1 Tax=Aspergillus awamori TaxID=105351 RepID=A0A401L1V9_ASPAW|nr:putative AC9 transposase [Aspergillus awamori]
MHGAHMGENMADLLHSTLEELEIEPKLLAITADNAANNESLMSELYFNLKEKLHGVGEKYAFRFQGVDSYIRCLAHVLNLIVSDILLTLKSGDHKTAVAACDLMQANKDIGLYSVLSRLRIMSLWITRTPQRKQQWKMIYQTNRLNDKFMEYDVDTRWNSKFRMIRDALLAKQQVKRWIDN